MKKAIDVLYITFFILCITVPGGLFNRDTEAISASENRYLAKTPELLNCDGEINSDFISSIESWFSDRIGFREEFIKSNTWIQYRFFHRLDVKDKHLGKYGDLNYADEFIIKDYQHKNLRTEKEVAELSRQYQIINDWLNKKGIQFFYMQCYDKHSIYPEQFMAHINQYGELSKTRQFVTTLAQKSTVHIVPVWEELWKEKDLWEVYSNFGDPTHWNDRGAFIGYQTLMKTINSENDGIYTVLGENAYEIKRTDTGSTINDVIHFTEYNETFELIHKNAVESTDRSGLGDFAADQRHSVYKNPHADNDTVVLIIGDSYINNYILEDIAESFSTTYLIWAEHIAQMDKMIDTCKPDIVIFESAERADRNGAVAEFFKNMENQF